MTNRDTCEWLIQIYGDLQQVDTQGLSVRQIDKLTHDLWLARNALSDAILDIAFPEPDPKPEENTK